ncbi:MAG: C39 family peptidase [Ruminococcus sp.]|nr:C39 family peptidase [Ruminococcus sp.]
MLKSPPFIAVVLMITSLLSSCGTIVEEVNHAEEVSQTTIAAVTTESATGIQESTVPSTTVSPTTEPFSVDVSLPENYEPPSSYVLEEFETVMQNPELPTGCEVTALAEVLNYLGFDIDKVELCDGFMPIDYEGAVNMYYAYVGDPKSNNGFGCYAPVILKTAYEYFESIDSPAYAVDLTGAELRDLFYQICNGRPVIVWSTISQVESTPNYKWTAGNGEDMIFNDYQHCLAIYGYDLDQGIIYAADPLVGNTTYEISRFERIYDTMYRQAIVICGDAETEGSFVRNPDIEENDVWSRKKQLE